MGLSLHRRLFMYPLSSFLDGIAWLNDWLLFDRNGKILRKNQSWLSIWSWLYIPGFHAISDKEVGARILHSSRR